MNLEQIITINKEIKQIQYNKIVKQYNINNNIIKPQY